MKVKQILLLLKLLKLAIQVSSKTRHDIFFYWYGHTHSLDITCHKGGWQKNHTGTHLLDVFVCKEALTPHQIETLQSAESTLKQLLKDG